MSEQPAGVTDPINPTVVRFSVRINRWVCRWIIGGPDGASCSGYSWNLEQRGSRSGAFWRSKIDLIFLNWRGQLNHCEKAWAKDMAAASEEQLWLLQAYDARAVYCQQSSITT